MDRLAFVKVKHNVIQLVAILLVLYFLIIYFVWDWFAEHGNLDRVLSCYL